VFKEPLSLEAFVKVLTGLGITTQQVRLVLRLTAKDPCPPPAWSLAALGPYGTSAVHMVKPPVERSAEAYKRWLGIQPKSGSYPAASDVCGGFGGPMTGAIRSLM
jgi:hypothetical protein